MFLRRIALSLRRIQTHDLNLSYRNHHFLSASTVKYPIGKDLTSLPLPLTQTLPQNPNFFLIDERPISLRYRVNSMIELSQLDKAAEISRLAVLEKHRNEEGTTDICNEIIGAMSDAKRYDEAIALFHYFFNESHLVPNIVSFNHIIKLHCDENRVDQALELYCHVRVHELDDEDTYRFLTKGLVNSGRIYEAVGMIKAVSLLDPVVYNYLIRGFLDQGNNHKANQLFDKFIREIPKEKFFNGETIMEYEKIAMVNATFVDYWFRQGNDDKAMEIYKSIFPLEGREQIHAKTVNTLLRILLENGKISEAWELFNDIFEWTFGLSGVKRFDSETINIMVNECFEVDMVMKGMVTFRKGKCFARCYRNVIERLCERGMMSEAEDLFDKMWLEEDMVLTYEVDTFRSLINGYVMVGKLDDAQRMLKKMVDTSLLKVSVHQAS